MSRNLWILGIAIVVVLPVLAPLALHACGGGACAMHGAGGGSHEGHGQPAQASGQGEQAADPAAGARVPADPAPAAAAKSGKKPTRSGAGKRVLSVYTCPMDPEVRQSAPGHCPKCGMNLELSKVPAAPRQNTTASGTTRN